MAAPIKEEKQFLVAILCLLCGIVMLAGICWVIVKAVQVDNEPGHRPSEWNQKR